MKYFTGTVLFLFGAAFGAVISWYYTKKYLTEFCVEENPEDNEPQKEEPEKAENAEVKTVENGVPKTNKEADPLKYARINRSAPAAETEPVKPVAKFLNDSNCFTAITQDEYNARNGYDKKVLKYYAENDILTDENDNPVENEDTVGYEFMDTMGHEVEDETYIRNEMTHTDYLVDLIDDSWTGDEEG